MQIFNLEVVNEAISIGNFPLDCPFTEVANSAIAILTPSQIGGGLGQIYIFNRSGAPLGTALSISLLTFVGTMVALLCFGLYSLLISGLAHIGPLLLSAVITLTLFAALIILSAIWPGFFRMANPRATIPFI
jgi:hypothetical protein